MFVFLRGFLVFLSFRKVKLVFLRGFLVFISFRKVKLVFLRGFWVFISFRKVKFVFLEYYKSYHLNETVFFLIFIGIRFLLGV